MKTLIMNEKEFWSNKELVDKVLDKMFAEETIRQIVFYTDLAISSNGLFSVRDMLDEIDRVIRVYEERNSINTYCFY